MKILTLIPDFPYPPRGGGPLRIMGLLPGAAAAGHEIHILAFGENIPDQTPLHQVAASVRVLPPPVRSKSARLKTLLLSGRADMARRRWSEDFLAALTDLLHTHSFDIVQAQSLEMTPYLDVVKNIQPHACLIYDAYNAEAELQRLAYQTDIRQARRFPQGVYSYMQWRRIGALEAHLAQLTDRILAVSEEDAAILRALPGAQVRVVPNGIRAGEYTTPPAEAPALQQPALVFTGIMDYRPNVDAAVWMAEQIFPLIQRQHPSAHLYLVGNRPHERVRVLAERPGITVTGLVPDVLPYLHGAAVFVVPMRVGSGTRFKVLEAMAAGCPVVSTGIGAAGLGVTDGREILLADTPHAFAQAVDTLLRDEKRRLELAATGQVFVGRRFDWSVIVPRLLEVYKGLG